MTRKKLIAIIAVVVVLLAAVVGFFAWRHFSGGGSTEGAVYVQSVSWVNSAGTGGANRFSGKIESQEVKKVEWDSSKTVLDVLVTEGQQVSEGDPLYTFDTTSMQLELEQGKLEIERQNNTISTSQEQITSLTKEKDKAKSSSDKLAYESQIQQLQADIANAQYAIKTKEAELAKLQNEINNATVYAPISGTVQDLQDVAEMMENGGYGIDGSPLPFMTILASGELRVKGKVSEQNIYDIYEGQPVIIRSRMDDSIWSGTISSIDTSGPAEEENNYYYYDSGSGESATNYAFYVELSSTDGLMMGQHVTIEPDYGQGEAKTGIWLDGSWLVMDDNGGASVWIANHSGRLTLQKVELGSYDEELNQYEIVSGISTSDLIAWPDVDCKEGAPTTQEYIWDDSDMMVDDMMVDDMGDEYYDDELFSDTDILEDAPMEGEMDGEEPVVNDVDAAEPVVDDMAVPEAVG